MDGHHSGSDSCCGCTASAKDCPQSKFKHTKIGIRSDAESAYDSDGMNVIWTVKNVGDHSVSFDKNAIAQILLNDEKYEFETEPITLEAGEEYSVEITIPYPVARQEMNNNLKITAETTGGTKATYKQSFEH